MALMLYIYPWINISDTFMPYCKAHTETVVTVAIAIVVVEVEWPCVAIVIVASTFEEWIVVAVVQADKVRVRSGKSPLSILTFRSGYARPKSSYVLVYWLFLWLWSIWDSPHIRYHITLLQGTHGNRCHCCYCHCCCRSRMTLRCYWDSSLHVWRMDSSSGVCTSRQSKSSLNAMMSIQFLMLMFLLFHLQILYLY